MRDGGYSLLGGSSHNLYVVNKHGDRVRPLRVGVWDPFQMAELTSLISLTYKCGRS